MRNASARARHANAPDASRTAPCARTRAPPDTMLFAVGRGAGRDRARDGLFGVERDRVCRARRRRLLRQAPARLARRRSDRRVRRLSRRLPALKRAAPYLLVGAIVSLALVFVPHVGVGGQRRAALDRLLGGLLQPSEFAKLALVIYLAAMLAARGERITSLVHGLFPLCVPVVIMAVLVLKEPDMGTASLLVFTAFAMFFAAGARISHLIAIVLRDATVRRARRCSRVPINARASLRS